MSDTLYHPDLPGLLLGLFLTLLIAAALSAWISGWAPRLLGALPFVLGWVPWTAVFARYSIAMYGIITATAVVGVSLAAAFGAMYFLAPSRLPALGASRSSYVILMTRLFVGAGIGVILFPMMLLAVLILFGIDSV